MERTSYGRRGRTWEWKPVGNASMLGLEKTTVGSREGAQEDERHLFDDFTLKQLFDISE